VIDPTTATPGMAQFLGDIAFQLEMVLVAVGLVVLHRSRQEGAGLLRAAALVLLLAGAGTAIGTSYFELRGRPVGVGHAHQYRGGQPCVMLF